MDSAPREHRPDLAALASRIRGLARAIAGESHLADDLAQDAWVALLRRPASGPGSHMQSGLSRTMRNLLRFRSRSETHRRDREKAVARPEQEACADLALERLELHRAILEAVYELKEPYRTTVLLRWFEELEPAEIARRTGVPVRTVHTRVSRALAMLRRKLGSRWGSGGLFGLSALVAWMSGIQAPALKGAVAMQTKTKVVVGAVLLSAVAVVVPVLLVVKGGPTRSNEAQPLLIESASARQGQLDVEAQSRNEVASATNMSTASSAANSPGPSYEIHGVVRDEEGRSLAGIEVNARNQRVGYFCKVDSDCGGAHADHPSVVSMTTGLDGAFVLSLPKPGVVVLGTRSSQFAPHDQSLEKHPDEYPVDVGVITLKTGAPVSGRIVDSSGRGISGARVVRTDPRGKFYLDSHAGESKTTIATTSDVGEFACAPQRKELLHLSAEATGFIPQRLTLDASDKDRITDLSIELSRTLVVVGTVASAEADDLDKFMAVARVHEDETLVDPTLPREFRGQCDSIGNFVITGIPPELRDTRLRVEAWNDLKIPEPLETPAVVRPGQVGVVLRLRLKAWCTFVALDKDNKQQIEHPTVRLDFYSGRSLRSRLVVLDRVLAIPPCESKVQIPVIEDPGARIGIAVGADGYDSYYVAGTHPDSGSMLDLGVIELSARPKIQVVVRDIATGAPIPRAAVFSAEEPIDQANGAPEWSRAADGTKRFYFAPTRFEVLTDQFGMATVMGSAEEPLWIAVRHSDYASSDPVKLGACDALGPVAINLRVGATIKVTVLKGGEPEKGRTVWLKAPEEVPLSAIIQGSRPRGMDPGDSTDENGQCQFSHLRPGTHALQVGSPPVAAASVTVLGDEVQEVTLFVD